MLVNFPSNTESSDYSAASSESDAFNESPSMTSIRLVSELLVMQTKSPSTSLMMITLS